MVKRITGILKNRWLLSVIGILALGVLIWFGGPLIAISGNVPLASEIARLVVILTIVLIWGVNNLRIQMKVNRANAELARDFSQPDTNVDDSQSEEEIQILRERFEEALQVLKKAGRKQGGDGVYDLPWYIIIGPPGSGKTTALVNSGLNFPLADRFGKEALRGVGGTRNCDWWFTDEAVFLDTAGRYTTQDSQMELDKSAWEGFLGLLKKHRRRRPINGALVAISLSDLMLQSDQERAAHVRAIRRRLQELSKTLEIRFPVYVMFTKCDLIAGFMEFFDDLGADERKQVWGATLPLPADNDSGPTEQVLEAEFNVLLDRINQRMLWRLNQERDLHRRALIFSFPQELASLRETCISFLSDIFRVNRFEDPLLLRGFYFCSGTQEGTPIDRIMGALARSFGISHHVLPASSGQGKSFFLTRLLRDVIFNESELVGVNRRMELQRQWLQRGAYVAAMTITVLFILGWATSYTRNQIYVNQVLERAQEYQRGESSDSLDDSDFRVIIQRLTRLSQITSVYQQFDDKVPFLLGMGLYQGDRLREENQEAYSREIERLLLPAIARRLEHYLRAGVGDSDFQYEVLKTYLMLGDAKRLDPDYLKLWFKFDATNIFRDEPDMQGQLLNHVEQILQAGFSPIDVDMDVVSSARARLQQVPLAQLLYERMKRDYSIIDQRPFRLIDLLGEDGKRVFVNANGTLTQAQISSLFTYEGYHDYFKEQVKDVAQLSSEENWVLDPQKGNLTKPEVEQLQHDLQKLYFADYIRQWNKLLDSIKIVPFRNLRNAVEVMDLISSPSSPMRTLLEAVSHNTILVGQNMSKLKDERGDELSAAENRLARLMRSVTGRLSKVRGDSLAAIVDKEFSRLHAMMNPPSQGGDAPIERVFVLLSHVYSQLDALSTGLGSDPLEMIKKGREDMEFIRRVQSEATRQPKPIKGWLQEIVHGSRAVIVAEARTQLNDEWRTAVLPLCNRALKGRYPFYKDARQQIALVDFARLFAPGGLIDDFFKANLKMFIDNSGDRWKWKKIGNSELGVPNAVLRQFQRAIMIRDTFFRDGSNTPQVNFILKPVYLDANIRSIRIDLEGQQFRYRHGPARSLRAQWPGPESTGRVRIEFEDLGGVQLSKTKEGPWAWFKLLDEAEISVQSEDRALVTFTFSGRKSSWEIRADSVVNPFVKVQLDRFRCPQAL